MPISYQPSADRHLMDVVEARQSHQRRCFADDKSVTCWTDSCRDAISTVQTMTRRSRLGGKPQGFAVSVQRTRSFIMSRIHTVATLIAISAFAVPAFASNGFTASNPESSGAYHAMPGGKTRAEVKAELAAAIKDGTMLKMNRNRSYSPEFETPNRAALNRLETTKEQVARGEGLIRFEAPAAGGRTRAEVLLELQRAREDGSLRLMNTNRGF
ncbi:MAG: DUF4148 domain-containing protein [Burkholderiales bacterium]|nr:DUF4148 domain-containing protein [Burkholderiales bacterium]